MCAERVTWDKTILICALKRASWPEMFPKAIRRRVLALLALVALVGMSVSARATQVHHILHSSVHSSTVTNTDAPVPLFPERMPVARLVSSVASQRQSETGEPFKAPDSPIQIMRLAAFFRHRAPPVSPPLTRVSFV
jgi:hypothetical protein